MNMNMYMCHATCSKQPQRQKACKCWNGDFVSQHVRVFLLSSNPYTVLPVHVHVHMYVHACVTLHYITLCGHIFPLLGVYLAHICLATQIRHVLCLFRRFLELRRRPWRGSRLLPSSHTQGLYTTGTLYRAHRRYAVKLHVRVHVCMI